VLGINLSLSAVL